MLYFLYFFFVSLTVANKFDLPTQATTVEPTTSGAADTSAQLPASTPSARRASSTSGITHMSPERDELSLFRDLFDGYDKRIRPVLRKEENVTVMLGISVFQLIDLVSGVCLRAGLENKIHL